MGKSLFAGRRFPLESLISTNKFYLNEAAPRYKYEDKQRTDMITGFAYLVTNTETFEQITIFVNSETPAIEPDKLGELHASGEKVFVSFENATIMPYVRDGVLCDSIKADSVEILNDEATSDNTDSDSETTSTEGGINGYY